MTWSNREDVAPFTVAGSVMLESETDVSSWQTNLSYSFPIYRGGLQPLVLHNAWPRTGAYRSFQHRFPYGGCYGKGSRCVPARFNSLVVS